SRCTSARRRASIALLLGLALLTIAADRTPWRARRRPDFQPNRLASERVRIDEWAKEPEPPATAEPETLARALAELCAFPSAARRFPARSRAGVRARPVPAGPPRLPRQPLPLGQAGARGHGAEPPAAAHVRGRLPRPRLPLPGARAAALGRSRAAAAALRV